MSPTSASAPTRQGRKVGVYTVAHVVCRETLEEARGLLRPLRRDDGRPRAVDAHMAGKKEFSQSHDAHAYDRYRQRFAGGAGTYPLIGTPETIADDMIAIAEQGYDGIALSFVNYTQELPYFCDRVLPLLRSAGYQGVGYFAGLASGFDLSTTNTLTALAGHAADALHVVLGAGRDDEGIACFQRPVRLALDRHQHLAFEHIAGLDARMRMQAGSVARQRSRPGPSRSCIPRENRSTAAACA